MEITVQELRYSDVIAVRGRLERSTVAQLTEALEASNRRGKYNLVVDMSQVEYISSAGYRALLNAQQNSRRSQRGELVLAQVPDHIQQALELTGFTELFKTFADLSAAIEFAEQLSNDLPAGASPPMRT
jgi:anti-sigma B factor antagonist